MPVDDDRARRILGGVFHAARHLSATAIDDGGTAFLVSVAAK